MTNPPLTIAPPPEDTGHEHDMGLRVSGALSRIVPLVQIVTFKRIGPALFVHIAPTRIGLRTSQDLNDVLADVVYGIANADGIGSVDTTPFRVADGQLYLGRVRVGKVEVWMYPSPELAESIGENGAPRRLSISLADA